MPQNQLGQSQSLNPGQNQGQQQNNQGIIASTYDPATAEFDFNKDTVEGRVQGIIAKNSAPMRQAKARSQMAMQGRGLLNTSMAVGAGESALYDYAMPMAQQDAAASLQSKQFNVGQQNVARQFGAEQQNVASRLGAELQNRLTLQDVIGRQSLEQIGARGQVEMGLLTRRGQIDRELQDAAAADRLRLQAEQARIDEELINVRGGIETDLLNRRGEIDRLLQDASAEDRAALLQDQAQIDRELTQLRGDVEADLMDRRGQIDLALQNASAEDRKELLREQGIIDLELQDMRNQNSIDLQGMSNQNSQYLAGINNEYQLLLDSSTNARHAMTTMQATISGILADPDLDQAARTELVNAALAAGDQSLQIIGAVGNIDLVRVLGGPPASGDQGGGQDPAAPEETAVPGPEGEDVPTGYYPGEQTLLTGGGT